MPEDDGLIAAVHLDREVVAIKIVFQVTLLAFSPLAKNREVV
jgi:hypothetical protein